MLEFEDILLLSYFIVFKVTVKPVLSGHSKVDKTKILIMTDGSLMKVVSIAECSLGAFCNTFDLHETIIGLENQFLVFFLNGCLRQVLLYCCLGLCCTQIFGWYKLNYIHWDVLLVKSVAG